MIRYKKMILTGMIALGAIGTANAASAAPYTVSGNDTMWSISKQYGVSLSSLIQANKQVKNPNVIWQGMPLNIPEFGWRPNRTTPFNGIPQSNRTPQSNSTTQSDNASQVINLVNQERAKAGLQSLASDSSLSGMALAKAKDMYNNHYFDHTSPTYGSPFDMMKSYGIRFSYAGENIAMGQPTPEAVMTAWMNSAGHRQNILNPNYTKIGVAYYNGEWVQEFIAN